MIRATRSRSSRPNHMPSRLDALQTTVSIDFRRFVGNFHSVAKQTSFYVAFRSDFFRCWVDLGRVWEPKMEAKIDFWEVFFRWFFRMRFGIDFGSFWGGPKPEKYQFFLSKINDFYKIDVFKKVMKKARFWLRFGRPK